MKIYSNSLKVACRFQIFLKTVKRLVAVYHFLYQSHYFKPIEIDASKFTMYILTISTYFLKLHVIGK